LTKVSMKAVCPAHGVRGKTVDCISPLIHCISAQP
jgi:hypothetical protein